MTTTNLVCLFDREFCPAVAPSLIAIGHVVDPRSENKMRRVATGRGVAGMAHVSSLGNRALVKLPSQLMSCEVRDSTPPHSALGKPFAQLAVSVRVALASPRP